MREYLECKCGTDMRVIKLDTDNEQITYECPKCRMQHVLTCGILYR